MSADNGIYIAKFPSGYRVAYGSAIENVSYYPEGSEERKEQLNIYFGKSKLVADEKEAILYAHELAKEYEYLEYGVSLIGEFEEFNEHLIQTEKVFKMEAEDFDPDVDETKADWFHIRNEKPTEMQLYGGMKKICNIQGKWTEELAEFIRMANLGIHVHREEIKMRIEAMIDRGQDETKAHSDQCVVLSSKAVDDILEARSRGDNLSIIHIDTAGFKCEPVTDKLDVDVLESIARGEHLRDTDIPDDPDMEVDEDGLEPEYNENEDELDEYSETFESES